MKDLKIISREELLMKKYLELVETASTISPDDREVALRILREATRVQVQIEELKQAKWN